MRIINFVFIIFFLLLMSCHKDDFSSTTEIISEKFTAEVIEEIQSDIIGYVYDENDLPVSDAIVMTYSGQTKTNQHGVFIFKNAKMDKQGTFIKVLKNGYMLGSDMVYPNTDATNYSYIKLLALESGKSFESNAGGFIDITGGGKVVFPADAIVKADGLSHEGKVNVTAKYLNPNDRELGNIMPGGLIADAANGNTVILGTLGMVAIELRDNDGNELNLKPGKKARIEFPAVTTTKPSQIQLWSFDEDKGWWKEEGVATLVNDVYVAEVSHFSFWNCDAPFPLINVCGKVLYQNGSPVVNIGVQVEADGLGVGYGYTDSNGEFCGKMPKGKVLTFTISHYQCTSDIYTFTAGPFENNVILDDIFIQNIPSDIIQGTINCNGAPVENGIVVVKVNEATIIFEASEDGSFSYDITSYLCGDDAPFEVFGFDTQNNNTSATFTVTTGATSGLNLNVCASNCDLTADFIFDCENTLTVQVGNGSGNYSYQWTDNLSSTATLTHNFQDTLQSGNIFCVTVTDTSNDCEKVFCKQVSGKPYVYLRNDCALGVISTTAFSSVPIISYNWTTGNTTPEIVPNSPGTYCVTVTDANGCSNSGCIDFAGPLSVESTSSSCEKNKYDIASTPFTSGNYYVPGTNIFGQLSFPIQVNIFETTFRFTVLLGGNQCEIVQEVVLPQLVNGLTTTAVNTTCGTCNDGYINITVNSGADCISCQAGSTKIFKISDLNTDLTTDNNNKTLSKGEYYVVVTDENTGCYIAFKKVVIN
jgi:hypothetical protein